MYLSSVLCAVIRKQQTNAEISMAIFFIRFGLMNIYVCQSSYAGVYSVKLQNYNFSKNLVTNL